MYVSNAFKVQFQNVHQIHFQIEANRADCGHGPTLQDGGAGVERGGPLLSDQRGRHVERNYSPEPWRSDQAKEDLLHRK